MVETQTSLSDRVAAYETGGSVAAVLFLDGRPALAYEDGSIVLGAPDASERIAAHPDGAILATATMGKALITGGDDGLVVRIGADGAREVLHDAKGKWIDALTAREDGSVAWATGKIVSARDAKGAVREIAVPTTARGLAFAPKGYRLAIAHYNGASFWFPNTDQAPESFEWKGSHVDVTVSPDGRFIVTSMQESALHGWRVSDHANMRMSGYPSRAVKSMAWSADGFVARDIRCADSCVVWPFREKDGPMNKGATRMRCPQGQDIESRVQSEGADPRHRLRGRMDSAVPP